MNWFVAAIISALSLSAQALAFRNLQSRYEIKVYMTYVWLGAAGILAVLFVRPDDIPQIIQNIIPLVLAGVSSWMGIYAYNRAIKMQSNLGYVEAVTAVRLAITYIVSLLLLGSSFDFFKLIGIIGIAVGVIMVAGIQSFEVKQLKLDWVFWSLLAGILFALLTIFVRFATNGGVSSGAASSVVLAIAGAIFFLTCQVDKTSLEFIERRSILALTVIFAALGNAALFLSYQDAPNLAYPVALSNTRIIILYLVGLLLLSDRLVREKAIGIVITFVGVILLS